jgi:hypothetical protein
MGTIVELKPYGAVIRNVKLGYVAAKHRRATYLCESGIGSPVDGQA